MTADNLDPKDQEVDAEVARLKEQIDRDRELEDEDEDEGNIFVRAYEAKTDRLGTLFQFLERYLPTPTSNFSPLDGQDSPVAIWGDERLTPGVKEARNRLIIGVIGAAQKLMLED